MLGENRIAWCLAHAAGEQTMDLCDCGVGAVLLDLDHDRLVDVAGAADHEVTGRARDRQWLAGQQRLVEAAVPFQQTTVGRDDLTGAHP